MYCTMQAADNKGAEQTARMRRLISPLLFAYGINRFSHDVAQMRLSCIIQFVSMCVRAHVCIHFVCSNPHKTKKIMVSFFETYYGSQIFIFSSPEPSGSQGELIVYPCSGVRCRCRRLSSTMFKHLLRRNRLANQSQIVYGASLGRGNESLYKWSRSHDQDSRHAHIW